AGTKEGVEDLVGVYLGQGQFDIGGYWTTNIGIGDFWLILKN
ncbi:11534_t:CDS:1, partial [Scutellospora calospora]